MASCPTHRLKIVSKARQTNTQKAATLSAAVNTYTGAVGFACSDNPGWFHEA